MSEKLIKDRNKSKSFWDRCCKPSKGSKASLWSVLSQLTWWIMLVVIFALAAAILSNVQQLKNDIEDGSTPPGGGGWGSCPFSERIDELEAETTRQNADISAIIDAILSTTREQAEWVEYGRSKCRDDIGKSDLYNFSTYKKQELEDVIAFDEQSKTNLFFYPGIVGSFPSSIGPNTSMAARFVGNTFDPEAFVKDISITTALSFSINISSTTIDWGRDDRVTLFLKNLRDRGHMFDYQGRWVNNKEKRRYMTALSKKVVMNRYLDKIDKMLSLFYDDITMYKKPVLSAYDARLIDFFLSIHVGDRHFPVVVKNYFYNFSNVVSSWFPTEPGRNESLLHMNANADCVIDWMADCAADILAKGDTTTHLWYWMNAGMSPKTAVTEAMHNWIAYRQFMHITLLVAEQSITPSAPAGGIVSTGGYRLLDMWPKDGSETEKINFWREMMRALAPNNGMFSRKPAYPGAPWQAGMQRAISIPTLIQMGAYNFNPAGFAPFNPRRYDDFNTTLSDAIDPSTSWWGRDEHIPFKYDDTPQGLEEVMRQMDVSPIDGETLLHNGEELIKPVFSKPIDASFGLGWRDCAGRTLVLVYGVRFMDKFYRLSFEKSTTPPAGGWPLIAQAPLKRAPDNIFVNQTALALPRPPLPAGMPTAFPPAPAY